VGWGLVNSREIEKYLDSTLNKNTKLVGVLMLKSNNAGVTAISTKPS